jgi:2-hydroxychromene-2-carboxylate isomerase
MENDVIEWLWQHQQDLSRDRVFDGVRDRFGLDIRPKYAALLPEIMASTAEARRMGVRGTPTFFLNGVQLPFVSTDALNEAIALEAAHTVSLARDTR